MPGPARTPWAAIESLPMPADQHHLALYAGSFDPITLGHLDVLGRARGIFDRLVLGIGDNPEKPALFSFEERIEMATGLVEEMVSTEPDGCPVQVKHYTGLTVDFAREVGAAAILRGIRNISDLAAETQLAITNRQVAGIETLFVVTGESFAYTSSSLIKQVAALGWSLDGLACIVPQVVIVQLKAKRDDPSNPLGRLAKDQLVE